MVKLIPQGQWNVEWNGKHDVAECLELDGYGIVGAVIDTEGCNVIYNRALMAQELYDALKKAEEMLRPFVRKMNIRKNFSEINAFENTIMKTLRKATGN